MQRGEVQANTGRRPVFATEWTLLAVSAYLIVSCNGPFWRAVMEGRVISSPQTWRFLLGLGVACTALTFLACALLCVGRAAKVVLTVLILLSVSARHFIGDYGILLDPAMLANVFQTDYGEARELVGPGLALALAKYAAAPIAVVWWVGVLPRSRGRAAMLRLSAMACAWLLALASVVLIYQDAAAFVRNHRSVRHLLTPLNILASAGQLLASELDARGLPRIPVGTDARLGAAWQGRARPVLLVLVVGETVRADHLGLNGYARDTTPELSSLGVVNFPDVTSCGTATRISLPCMFSARGRRDYDEGMIRREEGLLNVLVRAGFRVTWRDNQSGCKGVCNGPGITVESVREKTAADGCDADGCLDGALLEGLDEVASDASRPQVLVLHQLGNHGPAYYARYPQAYRRFTPTCDSGELRECSVDAIINTYDNAVLYTDHVLGEVIRFLQRNAERYDTALLYISDHGESLGEHGMFLHGLPYIIAPREQTHVPMVFWSSPSFNAAFGLDAGCLSREALKPASHDNLFHSLLGLLDVETLAYGAERDLFAACRPVTRTRA